MKLTDKHAMTSPWPHPSQQRPKSRRCARCKSKIKIKGRGRVPSFCSPTCRQLAYEQRRWQRPTPVELLAKDIGNIQVRDFIRAEIWSMLQEAGLVASDRRPPSPPPKRQRPAHLRVVQPPEHEPPNRPSEPPNLAQIELSCSAERKT
jgi:hypothetical protein